MRTEKTERLLNLLIMLLAQRHFVSKARIRAVIYPETASLEAFEKKFERDKDELRGLGVPIEVGQMDPYFDDEPGYRIRPDEFALPQIDLTDDEAAVVGLASRVWEQATLATATSGAVRKLTASGLEVDPSSLDVAPRPPSVEDPEFETFLEAIVERVPLEFDYWPSASAEPGVRHLQPYGVTRYSGRWYAVGYDTDRAAQRVFRLSRIQGEVRRDGRPGSFDIPAGVDLGEVARRLAPAPDRISAVLLVRRGSGLPLRAVAETTGSIQTDVTGPDRQTPWDRVRLELGSTGAADDLLSFGSSVVVEEPAHLRREIVARLTEVLA